MELKNLNVTKEELEQFQVILQDWIPKNASIAIAVANMYVHYSPSIHHTHLEIGEAVHPDSITAKVLKTRNKFEAVMDETILGAPYYAIGYPIYVDQLEAALIIILPSSYIPESHEVYKFLTGKQDEDWAPIPTEEISHIESLQKRTWFYANNNQYKTNITLKELQTRLPKYFLRIHRSYIINIYHIKKVSRDLSSNFIIKLKSGIELPVSQSYVNDLRRILEF